MPWAPDYATVDQVKDYLRIDLDDTEDDTFIALWITAVSRNIDEHCGRQFGSVAAQTRYYRPVYDRAACEWRATIDDLYDVTGLVVARPGGAVLAADAFELSPDNAPAKGRPYERIVLPGPGRYAVTAPWGWPVVPAAVPTAIFLQAARLAARRDSPFGVAGSPSEGAEMRLLAQLDPDFRTTLKPLRRKWWAA